MNKKGMGEIINLFPFKTTSFYNKRLSIIFLREKKKLMKLNLFQILSLTYHSADLTNWVTVKKITFDACTRCLSQTYDQVTLKFYFNFVFLNVFTILAGFDNISIKIIK